MLRPSALLTSRRGSCPVVNDPDYTPKPRWLPGWDALLVALGLNDSTPTVLSVASAFTNVLMPLALSWLARSPRKPVPKWSAWLLVAATLLNLLWAWPSTDGLHLGAGYWLWTTSFCLAAVLLVLRGGGQADPVPT